MSDNTGATSTETPLVEEVLSRFPGAWIDHDTIPFFRGLLEQRLLVNRCGDCANWYQPPWPVCPACHSDNVEPTEVSGRGVVYTYTRPAGAPAGFAGLAVIELIEQPNLRAAGSIVNCDPRDVRIGLPVELTWIERDGRSLPAFLPV